MVKIDFIFEGKFSKPGKCKMSRQKSLAGENSQKES